jgi:HlyD family secretion protein
VVLIVVVLMSMGSSKVTDTGLPTATVARGCMVVSSSETGDIVAEEQEIISNQIRWQAQIKEVVSEGRVVQEGELIVRMECKDLEDALLDQDMKVRQAEDDYSAAYNKLLITRQQMQAKVDKARQTVEDAKNDLKRYEEAEAPQKFKDATAAIIQADGDLKLSVSKRDAKLKINSDPELKQPYSDNEIESDRLNVQRLEIGQKKAETDMMILKDYSHPRTLRDKKNAVKDAQSDLETTSLDAETQIRLAEGGEESGKDRLTKQQNKLSDLKDDADKLIVHAKRPGLVVYDTRRRPWDTPVTLAVDEKMNSGQQLMIIPNMKTLQIQTRVYEAVREEIQPGLPAVIRLDVKKGQAMPGYVKKVSALPDTQNPWLSPGVKVYPTIVAFENPQDSDGLKPGMTADVEIIRATLDNVLSVPVAAVFSENDKPFCFRVRGGQIDRVAVTLGKTSDTRAEIVAGLGEGETVLLAPPPGQQVGGRVGDKSRSEVTASRPAGTSRPAGLLNAASMPSSKPAGAAPERGRRDQAGSGGGDRGGNAGGRQRRRDATE